MNPTEEQPKQVIDSIQLEKIFTIKGHGQRHIANVVSELSI